MMADGEYMVVLRRFDSSPSIFLTEVYAMAIIAWRGLMQAKLQEIFLPTFNPSTIFTTVFVFILPVVNNATFAFFKPNSALRRFSHRFTPIFIPASIAIKAYTYSVKQLELEESRSH